MSYRARLAVRVIAAVIVLSFVGLALVPGTFAPSAKGPYLSALNNVGVGTAWAAGKCNHRICEFVAPAHTCLFEGGATSCTKLATGGCTTTLDCR